MSSAAGTTGLTVDNTFIRQKYKRLNSSSMANNCALPTLQDMLEDIDASQLEEFAENLLADVITDLADDAIGSFKADAENTGTAKRLSEPMVGTKTENLEPAENIDDCLTSLLTHKVRIKVEPKIELIDTPLSSPSSTTIAATSMSTTNDSETLYGTYDESSYCVTVVLPNENIPIGEAVEEIVSSEDELMSDISLLSPIPSPGYSSSNASLYVADVSRSPVSIYSSNESGYESTASPLPPLSDMLHGDPEICDFPFDDDEFFSSSFLSSELFPTLY